MTCTKCGSAAPAGTPFCSVCGASLTTGGVMPPIPPPPMHVEMSTWALVGFILSFLCGLLGLIFSAIGYSECKRAAGRLGGKGLALAGLIISIVQLAIGILGILAAIAIPAFLDYNHPRSNEATRELRRIELQVRTYQLERDTLPQGHVGPTPATTCCTNADGKCFLGPADWGDPIWQQLGVELTGSHQYQYSYDFDGTQVRLTATADLDCDGTPDARYETTGTLDRGYLRFDEPHRAP